MTDIEKVRLKIGAVISATFTDAQIQAFLDMEPDINNAAAAAIESWAAAQISEMQSEKIGDYSYSRKSMNDALSLAERLRAAMSPAFEWAEMNLTGITDEEVDP
jgi:hypothetical protein